MYAPDLIQQVWDFIRQLFTLDPHEPLKTGAKFAAILGAFVTVAATLLTKTYPWLRAKIESRAVSKIFGEDLFTPKSIERAVRYYIPPLCQSIDPAGGEESRLIHSVQAPLFETLDKALGSESEEKYHILLADSGMGKSSAVTNYCVRHQRRWRKKYYVAMVPLGIPDADERIKRIENKAKTSLFLDALDEDTLAMVDHVERMRLLIRDTNEFRKVIITCRTQFFSNDEEIPKETGVLKITVRSAGESAQQLFYKIYLAPFSDDQVKAYLKRRYPIWQRKRRKQAFDMVAKIPLLTARPMLLAHIEDLVKSKRDFQFSYELYEEMVEAWIKREQGFVENAEALRDFSERLAVDLFLNRARRGAERISKEELKALAKEWDIPISDHKLSGRSLLNRDADGNFKFAHRSIMEHLFVQRFLLGDPQCLTVEWTDQMKNFIWERFQNDVRSDVKTPIDSERPIIKSLPLFRNGEEILFLRNILSSALQDLTLYGLDDLGSVSTETLLLLCSLILDRRGEKSAGLTLWRAASMHPYRENDSRIGKHKLHELRHCLGVTYANDWLVRDRREANRILVPDRAILMNVYPIYETPSLSVLVLDEMADALNQNRDAGRVLVVPIFLGDLPWFVLVAETGVEPFTKEQAASLSEVFSSLRLPAI